MKTLMILDAKIEAKFQPSDNGPGEKVISMVRKQGYEYFSSTVQQTCFLYMTRGREIFQSQTFFRRKYILEKYLFSLPTSWVNNET